MQLLSFVPELYPGGDRWLSQRLDDCAERRASCLLATFGSSIVGTAIDTPKGAKRRKLSTFFVAPTARGRGIGSRILDTLIAAWSRADIESAYVTVADSRDHLLRPLLVSRAFSVVALEHHRYGDERHELIYEWRLK
ncbi:MAG TPA: GNAT family N-acetyltransferase [Thermoanaerobaculia bacterium]|nr:GNAT family N-acetyltransferase [Thermoanaerobaculia bacterium]